MTSRC